jgi:hypothetical protein
VICGPPSDRRSEILEYRAMHYEAARAVLERIARDADQQTRATLLTVALEMGETAVKWWQAALT